jgi:uncharacterized protein YuzE
MLFTYDDEADALYVYVSGRPGGGGQVARSEVLSDGRVADLDVEGNLLGLEILMASHGVRFGDVVERFGLDEAWNERLHSIEAMRFTPSSRAATPD